MTVARKYITQVVEAVLESGYQKATKYVSPTLTVTATRRHVPSVSRDEGITEVVLTIGKPNYAARLFIGKCLKAGEPFPVKKIQFKAFPVRKNKAAARKKK